MAGSGERAIGLDLIVRQVRIEGREGTWDVGIAGDTIHAIEREIRADAPVELAAEGRLASPAFVESHIHLDKVETRSLLPPVDSFLLEQAVELQRRVKEVATPDEIAARAGATIRRGILAGTTAFRTHVDVDSVVGLRALEGVAKARAEHADLCDIEIVAFPQYGLVADTGTAGLMAEAMRRGADVVGGIPAWETSVDNARAHIEHCFRLAEEHDADVDMHIDETDDASSRTLELLVEATLAHAWQGRVTAGHCCSMAAWPDDYAAHVIHRLAEAGMSVITNPATNLMIQGRMDPEPRRRGIARVKELLAAGVTVAAGQDNLEDAFYPFSKADQLLLAFVCAHAAQLASEPELEACLAMIRHNAAAVLRRDRYGLVEGARADLVVLDAETPFEALARQAARRWVIHAGHVVAETRVEAVLGQKSRASATSGARETTSPQPPQCGQGSSFAPE